MLPLMTRSAVPEYSQTEAADVGEGPAVGDGVAVGTGVGIDDGVVAGAAPTGALQPAATASSSVQNHLSPCESSIVVRE